MANFQLSKHVSFLKSYGKLVPWIEGTQSMREATTASTRVMVQSSIRGSMLSNV